MTNPLYNKTIIDISIKIVPGMIIYPGNPQVIFSESNSETSELTKIEFGSHTATHIDAPRHSKVSNDGINIFPLDSFIGPVRVIDATHESEKITLETVRGIDAQKSERLLFKTKNSELGFDKWRDDYVYLDGDAASFLASCDISLFGLDWISVKQKGNPDNRAHTELLQKNIPILEGLDLSNVKPGIYELIFLPLRLEDLDGAPGRAILLQENY